MTSLIAVALAATLAPGARVRITRAAESSTILPLPDTSIFGVLRSSDDTTLTIVRANGEGSIVIPRAAIGRLAVHDAGKKSARGKGIVLGFLGGAFLGFAYGMVGHPGLPHSYEIAPVHEAATLGVLFSLPGMVVGGLRGGGREPGWREVPIDSRVRIGLGSTGRGAGLRIAVGW
jgi:hypothetical protein